MIEFKQITKQFPDGTVAVDEFDLIVPSRQITVLAGSSGCGKTTLLRMVNRMVEPTTGSILIDGEDVKDEPPVQLRRRIGYVMQNAGLLPHFTIADNIATVPRLQGQSRAAARSRALELLETVGLEPHMADRYPHQVSGGQQQRVGVARALASDPNILLMDEPFGAVDPIVRTELQQELLQLQRELGKTVIFVTHDIDEAFLLGDQVVILAAGAQKLQVGTPNEILENPASDFVASFIGAGRGKRVLRIKQTETGPVVVDADGRTQGILSGGEQ
jgi:osmoprotectant transport system ATP-binding protein